MAEDNKQRRARLDAATVPAFFSTLPSVSSAPPAASVAAHTVSPPLTAAATTAPAKPTSPRSAQIAGYTSGQPVFLISGAGAGTAPARTSPANIAPRTSGTKTAPRASSAVSSTAPGVSSASSSKPDSGLQPRAPPAIVSTSGPDSLTYHMGACDNVFINTEANRFSSIALDHHRSTDVTLMDMLDEVAFSG